LERKPKRSTVRKTIAELRNEGRKSQYTMSSQGKERSHPAVRAMHIRRERRALRGKKKQKHKKGPRRSRGDYFINHKQSSCPIIKEYDMAGHSKRAARFEGTRKRGGLMIPITQGALKNRVLSKKREKLPEGVSQERRARREGGK